MGTLHRRTRGSEFEDWLVQSCFVNSVDETSAVLSRKKCRSHRRRLTSGGSRELEQRSRLADGSYRVANKHYRRWNNDRLLRELAPPMDANMIDSLFAPPPWGEKTAPTALERVTAFGPSAAADRAAWEPFRNDVDMDAQAKILQRYARTARARAGSQELTKNTAMSAWRRVEHRFRDILKRNSSSPILQQLEEAIFANWSENDRRSLVFPLDEPFHRILLRGLSQFHNFNCVESDSVPSTLVLMPRRDQDVTNSTHFSLVNFLQLLVV